MSRSVEEIEADLTEAYAEEKRINVAIERLYVVRKDLSAITICPLLEALAQAKKEAGNE